MATWSDWKFTTGMLEQYYDAIPLYKNGDECVDVTGGWLVSNKNGTTTKNADNITIYGTNGNAANPAIAYTKNKVDLTDVVGMVAIITDKIGTAVTYNSAGIVLKTAIAMSGNYGSTNALEGTTYSIVMINSCEMEIFIYPQIITKTSAYVEVRACNPNGFTLKELYLLKQKS